MISLRLISFLYVASLLVSYLFAKERPNIIFLLSDDQSTYSLGCYGNEDVNSPQLDRLANDGMVFDRHYDTITFCMASRASVMTGMYEYKHGTNFGHGDMLRKTWKTLILYSYEKTVTAPLLQESLGLILERNQMGKDFYA